MHEETLSFRPNECEWRDLCIELNAKVTKLERFPDPASP